MDRRTDDLLADLVIAWEDRFRMGQDTPAAELACEHPELITPLARRIDVLKRARWLDQPHDPADDAMVDGDDAGPAEPRTLAGRYRLDRRVAVGGFSEVWRAFDEELERVVAVKIPKSSRIAMSAAFLAEARRVARLRHPAGDAATGPRSAAKLASGKLGGGMLAAAVAALALMAWRLLPDDGSVQRPSMPAATPVGSPPQVSLPFASIEDALPYAVFMENLRVYREWQTPPVTYLGPMRNGIAGSVVFRFDVTAPITAARLTAASFCTDFTREPGGQGRGASALAVSRDGRNWHSLHDNIAAKRWSGDWRVDGPLPGLVLGGTSILIRVQLLTDSCPNAGYTVAQFGRAPHPPGDGALRLILECAESTAGRAQGQ